MIGSRQGVRCKRVARCISSVGLYVPGGTAVLPSTALMLSVVRGSHRHLHGSFSMKDIELVPDMLCCVQNICLLDLKVM